MSLRATPSVSDGLGMIPADEIDGIGEAGAARRPTAGLALILRPGAVERLR